MRLYFYILISLALAIPASAQTKSISELTPLLPVTPSIDRRDLRSENQDFNTDPRSPVAGFVDSLTDSDAIIEVVLGRSRIISLKEPLAVEQGVPLVAVGDPTILDFDIAGPRFIRLATKRVGTSDFTVTTDRGETYAFDIHVVYDIPLMQSYLHQLFPDSVIKLRQLREHIVLEGQARSTLELAQIEASLRSYIASLQPKTEIKEGTGRAPRAGGGDAPPQEEGEEGQDDERDEAPTGPAPIEVPDAKPETSTEFAAGRVINLMTVPGVQQVMLKVQVAELNRTSLRQIGVDISVRDDGRPIVNTFLGNFADSTLDIFPTADLDFYVNALRLNSVLNVLAEPTLVTMHGQEASFLAGGEFPFPVPQTSGVNFTTTIQFKPFGVQLNFVPYILDDDTIRLRVAPEVSSLNFNSTVTIGGVQVPAIDTRAVNTTVELSQGQTLAIGGLLQVELEASTQRLPGLGDLPYIGPMFSNTSHQRVEKELLVLVTPHLVSPLECNEHYCLPGQDILDPNDCEFYFLNRIEGRTGTPYRSPTAWDNPLHLVQKLRLESRAVCGPMGYSE